MVEVKKVQLQAEKLKKNNKKKHLLYFSKTDTLHNNRNGN